ncbi:TPA: hypothetical protein HA251_03085 [Candidatus Woesearchaeota archaeon]|nr:hypothetical protein [Candidatus Woesearchaeota archaeon]
MNPPKNRQDLVDLIKKATREVAEYRPTRADIAMWGAITVATAACTTDAIPTFMQGLEKNSLGQYIGYGSWMLYNASISLLPMPGIVLMKNLGAQYKKNRNPESSRTLG